MGTLERSRWSSEQHLPNKEGVISTKEINASLNQINLEPAIPEPTLDLLGLRNDKENVMENIFDSAQDIRDSDLSYDRKIGEVPILVPRSNGGPSSSMSTNEPIRRSPF